MNIIHQFKSANFDLRPENTVIDTIIIHYTEMTTCGSAIKRLCNKEFKVSCHYIIAKNGNVYNLVDEKYRAWHAGVSYWDGREKVNDFSIGIELDNNGQEPFSHELMNSLIALCQDIIERNPIKQHYILGHSDIAVGRKIDPGRLFNWQALQISGIGLFPKQIKSNTSIPKINEAQLKFKEFGYKIDVNGILDEQTKNVIRSFCDHYYPENTNNDLNSILFEKLSNLVQSKLNIE